MLNDPTVRNGHVSHGSDASAYVRFYKYNDKGQENDFVEIIFPGDTRSEMRREVNDTDKMRWPQAYEAYKNGEVSKASGFPLDQWPQVDEGMIRELNHKRIYTVDQLASVSDANLPTIGLGAQALVAKAKAFLELRKDAGAIERYAEQFESMKAENKLLQDQNQSLAARLQALEDSQERKTLSLKK